MEKQGSQAGPRAELEQWRSRLAALTQLTERLRSRECRLVIGIAGAARCKAHKAWRDAEAKVGRWHGDSLSSVGSQDFDMACH